MSEHHKITPFHIKEARKAPLYGLPNIMEPQLNKIPRDAAVRMIQRLMQRVERANSGVDKLSFRITKIAVFGSFLTEKTHLGDIDIFFSFESVLLDNAPMKHHLNGTKIPYFCDGMTTEEVEVRRFLVNRSKQFHLLDFSASAEMKNCVYHILFEQNDNM